MRASAAVRSIPARLRGVSRRSGGALALAGLLGLASAQQRGEPPLTRASGPGAAADWSARIGAELRRAEYRFQPLEPGVLGAPNRAQELRLRVSARGLELCPRAVAAGGAGAPWRLELRTSAWGRGHAAAELAGPRIEADASRVRLEHGPLVEWLENRAEGIEQGWTVAARPPGDGPLWLALELGGGLALRIADGARGAVFVDAAGEPRVRYADLRAFDATQRELAARLLPAAGGFRIEVDDRAAVYPLTIDPVLTGPAWTAEGDQAGADLGWSVAAAGDVNGDGFGDVLVGADEYDGGEVDEGRVFLFTGSAAGLAAAPAWTMESNQAGAFFGAAVATAGDVNGDGFSDVIVGGDGWDGGQSDEGRAWVFLGSAAGLAKSAAWTAECDQAFAGFGWSASTAGDVNGDGYSDVVVGALLFDNGQMNEGRAFVYLGSAAGLAASPAWTAEGNQINALFAHAVATAGDVNGDGYDDVLVGARMYLHGEVNEGAAFVYLGSAAGLATLPAWFGESNQASAFYGWSVAPAGDVNGDGYGDVLVGALLFDAGQRDTGRAYVYLGSPSGLESAAAWTADGAQAFEHFAHGVSSAGDVNGDGYGDVLVGAEWYADGQAEEGGAFVYLGSASGLEPAPAWSAQGDQDGAHFGFAVGGAGDVNGDGYGDVLVGANLYDGVALDAGRAYAFLGSPEGLAPSAAWTSAGGKAGADLGVSVASAGDVNGDGYGDVLVGADGWDNGQVGEGRALVHLGSEAGLAPSAAWSAEGEEAGASFGWSVSAAGDVNGDGYGDVLIGAPFHDGGQANEGRALVFLGSAAGLAASPAWTVESNQINALFGWSVSAAGDVNGDGFGDVAVGARAYVHGEVNEGAAFVYLGSPAGLAGGPGWFGESNQPGALYGWSVSAAGDVNADGYGDVLVGTPYFDTGQRDTGRAWVYLGGRAGLAPGAAWTADGPHAFAHLGVSVASAGDVNGDGASDVILGAEWYANVEAQEGGAFVYLGSPGGLGASPAWTAEGEQVDARFGSAVAAAGDVNGDGYGDVLVGAPLFDHGESDEGRAFLYLGSALGLAPSADWTAESDQAGASLGWAVAAAGDVDGDGFGDALAGAATYDAGALDEGAAFVFLGNHGHGGRVHGLQQRRRDGSAPIAPGGRTGEDGLFRLRARFARSLAGSSWAAPAPRSAWLEWEVEPLGVPFDGQELGRGTPQALVPGGGLLTFDELARVGRRTAKARATGAGSWHWRARVATDDPLFPHTAWFGLAGDAPSEATLRMPAVRLR